VKDVLLLDVTPLTLAIETAGGVATPMIPRNTTIPTKKSQIFRPTAIISPAWKSSCCRASARCRATTRSSAPSISTAFRRPRGACRRSKSPFDIDANGILHVSAKDLGTGKEQKISITGSSGLSKEEVEKMQKEAELHAEEDRKAREAVEVRNNADNLAYQCEKQLKELGDKLSGDQRSDVEKEIANVREALKGNDVEAIKTAYTNLQNKFQGISEDLYKQAAATAGAQGGPGPGPRRRCGPGTRKPSHSRAVQPRPTATSLTPTSKSSTRKTRSNARTSVRTKLRLTLPISPRLAIARYICS
jgi:molecular chaperone DnaK